MGERAGLSSLLERIEDAEQLFTRREDGDEGRRCAAAGPEIGKGVHGVARCVHVLRKARHDVGEGLTAHMEICELRSRQQAIATPSNRKVVLASETMFARPGVPKYRLSIRSPVLNRRWRAAAVRDTIRELFCSPESPSSSSSPECESLAACNRSLRRWFSARSFRIS